MRLGLPRFDDLRLGLRPGWYELPSHVERDEAWRLLELLARALDGIEDVLECGWFELDRPLDLGPTTLMLVTVPEQIERGAIQARLASLPVRFGLVQHAGAGRWPDIAWDEMEVKSALAAGLRKWIRKPTNPLASMGMAEFPVDRLVEATSEPIELLVLAESTIAYAIRQHEESQAIDWDSCARWSIGRRLADRLFKVERELLGAVRDAITQSRDGTLDRLQHPRVIDELVRVGLAHRHEGDAMLVPLARTASEPQVIEILDLEGVTAPEPVAPTPTQVRATTPSEAIIAFDPLTPVMPGDPWFVDLRQVAPEIRDFGKLFAQQLMRRDRAIRLEVLQEPGGGATTMVRSLLRELASSGIVTIDVDLRSAHPEFEFVELLVRTLSAISTHCEQSKIEIDNDALLEFWFWLKVIGAQSEFGELRNLMVHDPTFVGQPRLRSALTFLERLLESADGRQRSRIRRELGLRCNELLDYLTRVIDGLRPHLLARGHWPCLHYQGSASFSLAMGHRTFAEHSEDFSRLDCHIVFGSAWATQQKLSDRARLSTEYRTLTYPSFGENPETAREVVHAVLAARAELEQVFVRPQETVTRIADLARGNLRGGLELAKLACEMTSGQRLRALRHWRGWTQAELATAAYTSEKTVARAERGFEIRPSTLRYLTAALGVELDDLLRPGPASLPGRVA